MAVKDSNKIDISSYADNIKNMFLFKCFPENLTYIHVI